jgi:hypothetical protein
MNNNMNKPLDADKKSMAEKAAHKVGDAIERVGQKIQDAGAGKAGRAVYNAGDKIEHSADKKTDLNKKNY